MMMPNYQAQIVGKIRPGRPDDSLPFLGMCFHHRPFFIIKGRGLQQYMVRNPDLSDIVEKRAQVEQLHFAMRQTARLAQFTCKNHNPITVAPRISVTLL
ncbi:protein of unknown function [Georgfuchsia toluolica]|uniref:Uncharacterized protein n=1 Tax=Georgfuchsia toluolica TaxID=424218 RepID=A0A916J6C6_9PROT|nr:protein of unknown function [Georgfuchsia toluolica]